MIKFKHLRTKVICLVVGLTCYGAQAGDYSKNPEAQAFIDRMVEEHQFERAQLQKVIGQAEKKQKILDAIARPAEKTKPWYEYREIFLGESRIQQGAVFWQENADILQQVSEQYSVDPAIIVAIIGVETRYGSYMGNYRVVDALATLGFDYPPRAKFFASQLEQFFLLTREQKQDPLNLMGSYAGAMGYGQFIPSSYRHYARDFDGDGFADIWQNKKDAIASVANYFKAHGWQKGGPVVVPATVSKPLIQGDVNSDERPSITLNTWYKKGVKSPQAPKDSNTKAALMEFEQPGHSEYWLGFNNFYVITRYNRSRLYALAVWQLSEAIRVAREQALQQEKLRN